MNIFSAALRVLASIARVIYSPIQTLGLRYDPSFPKWKRKQERRNWYGRMGAQVFGPPHLTGARLERTIEACSPAHLTVQPFYRREAWEKTFANRLPSG